jgi:SH3 domain protein
MLRILFVLLMTFTSAQAAHITDKLLVGLYAKPAPGVQPIKVLPSGTPLEVLERKDAYSKVRLGDGKEGWVKSVYISDEKPARAMLLELQAKTSTLKNKLRDAEEKLKSTQPSSTTAQTEQLKKVEQELTQTKEKLALAGDALKSEQQETKRLMTLLKKTNSKDSENKTAEINELKKKLSASKSELSATLHEAQLLQDLLKKTDQTSSKQIADLEQELVQTKKKLEDIKSTGGANPKLIQQNKVLRQRFNQVAKILSAPIPKVDVKVESESSFSMWIPTIVLLMIAGFVGGVVFNNFRLRKRHGNYRV